MLLFEKKQGQNFRCLACSHYCFIAPGQTGLCSVRENALGKMELLVYGRPCAIHIDPIEKKPLYHFLPGTKVLSLGTFGCNFSCSFCQNWDISQVSRKGFKGLKGDALSWKNFLKELDYWSPEKMVALAIRKKALSIAYTYNEPTIWMEYTMDIAKLAKENNIQNVYVSNGFMSKETVEGVAPYLDAINIDLKSFSEEFYQKICQARLQPVLDNIKRFTEKGVWVEVTTLVVPGQNDSAKELKQISEFLTSVNRDIPWHLSAFHGDYEMRQSASTSLEKLLEAREIGKKAGLNYVYVGNVLAGDYANTYCQKCGELLIERGYMSGRMRNLFKGKCGKCGHKIKGVFP